MSSSLQLASTAHRVATSATLEINERVLALRAEGRDVIHLGFGEASFPLLPALREALAKSATATAYGPVLGIAPLRQAIADYLGRERGIATTADRIAVGPGSKPLLYALVQLLEGDVLVPAPSWVSYAPQIVLAERRVVPVATDARDHHRVTPAALDAAVERATAEGANPRVLIVNSPSNPTGGMFAAADVEALADWARRRHVTVISDEIYAELAHGIVPHVSPARFYPEGTIVTAGLSKSFSAGGWRLGYAVFPAGEGGTALLSALRALASEIWSSAAMPVQEAAVSAFLPSDEVSTYVKRSARLHGHTAGRLFKGLTGLGIACPRPAGAFYLYPDFAPFRAELARVGVHGGLELARYLLEKHHIATLPGVAFGDAPEALRLRLAVSGLYEPGEALHVDLLKRTDAFASADPLDAAPLSLPLLERAVAAFGEVVRAFR
ncbi:aminotransferase class I/II-fold pyridoxal phosphate-dependent enzyme [Pendulispora brunnea]|uniref:Aminotransferase n=1 Tax=Pendulispora brunnea TaxID=2905690 RepID=A0ABZ2JYI1_9BACT